MEVQRIAAQPFGGEEKKPKPKPKPKKKEVCGITSEQRKQLKFMMRKVKDWKKGLEKEAKMLAKLKGKRDAKSKKRREVLQKDLKRGKKELKTFKVQLNKLIKKMF